jgi:2-methylcitrate dehydratase PrpD
LAEDIAELVVLDGGQSLTEQLTVPLESKRQPQSTMDAKFSIPFTAAIMALRGSVTLADYVPDALRDHEVLGFAQRIWYEPPVEGSKPRTAGVRVVTRDGRSLTRWSDNVPGDLSNPSTFEDLVPKFRDCLRVSVRPVPDADIETAVAKLRNLEAERDVRELLGLIA